MLGYLPQDCMEQYGKAFDSLAVLYSCGTWTKKCDAPTIQESDLQAAVAENNEAGEIVTKEPEKTGKAGKAAVKNTAKKDTKAAKQEPEEKPLTLEEVWAVLAEKSRSGHTEEVRDLLNKHGADKLSEIAPRRNTLRSLWKRRCCDGKTRFTVRILQPSMACLPTVCEAL